jgi:hypothetical protein
MVGLWHQRLTLDVIQQHIRREPGLGCKNSLRHLTGKAGSGRPAAGPVWEGGVFTIPPTLIGTKMAAATERVSYRRRDHSRYP